jgi:hypothetical protein
MLAHCASGDLIRPAHNKLYQRLNIEHNPAAVPLGCGQLGSGVDWLVARPPRPAYTRMPYCGSNGCPLVTTAYAKCSNLRAAAQRATFGGLPAARKRS